ncbi:MAG: polysaccharide deacetylase family protein [Candidatus Thorarchaeota archaeon]
MSLEDSVSEFPYVEEFRGGKKFAFMLCWDDGNYDLEFSLMEDEIGIKHTSFVVTSRVYDKVLWGLDMLFRGHDIQSHSQVHLNHKSLENSYQEYLLEQSKLDIKSLFGYSPILFAYPYGASDSYLRSHVLDYYRVARGIVFEKDKEIGQWPIQILENAKHTFPDADGLTGENLHELLPSFGQMIANYEKKSLAYKAYGHTKSFTDEQITDLRTALSTIANRTDTWITTWGEAVAYQIQRDSSNIYDYRMGEDFVSFNIRVPEQDNFGIPLTYRIEIPEQWEYFTVLDGGKISDRFSFHNDAKGRYILLDAVPNNQRITVEAFSYHDTLKPIIRNLRTIVTTEGVAFLADVSDAGSLISNVNITVSGNGSIYEFTNVRNPLFWSNSTYGRVLFGIIKGCYQFKVTARDASGNIVVLAYNFNLEPTHRLDMPS